MSFTLRWKNPNVIATVINIYRDTKDISPSALPAPIATLSNGETEWRDTTAVPGSVYYYLLTTTANGKTVASASQRYTIEVKRGIGPMTILNGDDRLGYMGPVPYDEQWQPGQMPAGFLAIFPNLLTDRVGLHKFTRNGKILYLMSTTAQLPYQSGGVNWASLYQAGLVYGTGDTGPANGHGSLPATLQDAKVVHNGDTYIMRLPRGLTSDTDPAVYPFVDAYAGKDHDTTDLTNPCEYNDLIYAMVNEVPVKQRWANWNSAAYTILAQGNITSGAFLNAGVLCMEHDTVQDRVLHRAITNNSGNTPVSLIQRISYPSPSVTGRYMPIFELVE